MDPQLCSCAGCNPEWRTAACTCQPGPGGFSFHLICALGAEVLALSVLQYLTLESY